MYQTGVGIDRHIADRRYSLMTERFLVLQSACCTPQLLHLLCGHLLYTLHQVCDVHVPGKFHFCSTFLNPCLFFLHHFVGIRSFHVLHGRPSSPSPHRFCTSTASFKSTLYLHPAPPSSTSISSSHCSSPSFFTSFSRCQPLRLVLSFLP